MSLMKDQCTVDIREYSLSQRTINKLNILSTDCVNASTVNMFKNKIDKQLRMAGYTQVKHCWTLDKTMISLSTVALDGNLVKSLVKLCSSPVCPAPFVECCHVLL